MDYVREVSTETAYQWDPDDRLSERWSTAGNADAAKSGDHFRRCGTALWPTIMGSRKTSCAGCARHGFGVTVVPAATSAEEVLALESGRSFSFQRSGRSGRACPTRMKPFAD